MTKTKLFFVGIALTVSCNLPAMNCERQDSFDSTFSTITGSFDGNGNKREDLTTMMESKLYISQSDTISLKSAQKTTRCQRLRALVTHLRKTSLIEHFYNALFLLVATTYKLVGKVLAEKDLKTLIYNCECLAETLIDLEINSEVLNNLMQTFQADLIKKQAAGEPIKSHEATTFFSRLKTLLGA